MELLDEIEGRNPEDKARNKLTELIKRSFPGANAIVGIKRDSEGKFFLVSSNSPKIEEKFGDEFEEFKVVYALRERCY